MKTGQIRYDPADTQWQMVMRPSYNIVTFHRITTELASEVDPTCLSAVGFEWVLNAIAGRPNVRVTFDDGNESDVEIALPALRHRNLVADFFLCAGKIGGPGYLDGNQIRTLVAAGMRIGSHGMDHRPWRGLADDELSRELVEARERLESLCGHSIDSAACPFGAYDRRVLGRLKSEGYREVFTSDRGPASPGSFLQSRTTLKHTMPMATIARVFDSPGTSPRQLVRRMKVLAKRLR